MRLNFNDAEIFLRKKQIQVYVSSNDCVEKIRSLVKIASNLPEERYYELNNVKEGAYVVTFPNLREIVCATEPFDLPIVNSTDINTVQQEQRSLRLFDNWVYIEGNSYGNDALLYMDSEKYMSDYDFFYGFNHMRQWTNMYNPRISFSRIIRPATDAEVNDRMHAEVVARGYLGNKIKILIGRSAGQSSDEPILSVHNYTLISSAEITGSTRTMGMFTLYKDGKWAELDHSLGLGTNIWSTVASQRDALESDALKRTPSKPTSINEVIINKIGAENQSEQDFVVKMLKIAIEGVELSEETKEKIKELIK